MKSGSEKAGLFLNLKRTKVMKIQRTSTENGLEIDGYNFENVHRFTYLGATFTNTVEDSTEVKRRIGIARNATIALNNIWKNRDNTLITIIRLLKTMVFSIISYGSECWVLKAADRQKLDSFKLWCCRRLLGISWKEKKTNEEVIRRLNCRKRLTAVLDERTLSFVGHQLRTSNSLEKTLPIDQYMVKDQVEDQEPGSVTILRRYADTHWLRLREKRRTEETGGALFSGPRQFELEQCVINDDDDRIECTDKWYDHLPLAVTKNKDV